MKTQRQALEELVRRSKEMLSVAQDLERATAVDPMLLHVVIGVLSEATDDAEEVLRAVNATPKFERYSGMKVHAVGATVEEAITVLGTSLKWGKISDIVFQETDSAPCSWYVRFKADGTSMKASGEYLNGGVIVTWWK